MEPLSREYVARFGVLMDVTVIDSRTCYNTKLVTSEVRWMAVNELRLARYGLHRHPVVMCHEPLSLPNHVTPDDLEVAVLLNALRCQVSDRTHRAMLWTRIHDILTAPGRSIDHAPSWKRTSETAREVVIDPRSLCRPLGSEIDLAR